MNSLENYRRFAQLTLAFCVLVIVWGAYVRATGSGAGCGSHWPLCNGVVIPSTERLKTLIEFSHRLSSGLLLVLVSALALWAWRLFPSGSFSRRAALMAFVAVILEALVGALLVLRKLVEMDESLLRVLVISLHLVNTLFLLAALTCTAFASAEARPRWRWPDPKTLWRPRLLVAGFAFLGAFGAIAALGDTLFPPTSLLGGLLADFAGKGHLAERIRILHPLLAVLWVGAAAAWAADLWERFPALERQGKFMLFLAGLNLILGVCNLLFLAPLGLQMLHLFVANLLWIVFISLLFSAASRWQ